MGIRVQSALRLFIVKEMLFGRMFGPQVHMIVKLAKQDIDFMQSRPDCIMPDIDAIAKVSKPGNLYNQVLSKLNFPLPDIYECRIPVKLKPNNPALIEWMESSIILPHEMFAWMYDNNRRKFDEIMFGGEASKLTSFWDSVQRTRQFQAHPFSSASDFKTSTIPIMMHGDGVPCVGVGKNWGNKFDGLSWMSHLAWGTMEDKVLLIFGMYPTLFAKIDGATTIETMLALVKWSPIVFIFYLCIYVFIYLSIYLIHLLI